MLIATWVLTCMSWFSISRMTCLTIFSGSSARSMRSFRLARRSVPTLSNSAMIDSFLFLVGKPLAYARGCDSLWFFAVRPRRGVSDGSHLREQLGHLHARERLEERRDLRGHLRQIASDFVHARRIAAGRDNGDLVHVLQRCRERLHNLRHAGDQLVDDRRLVVFLISLGLHVHGLRFGLALLERNLGFRFALCPDGRCAAFRLRNQFLPFR